MDYEVEVDCSKFIFFVSEEVQNNVLNRRGIACSVSFEGETFLLTSSSAVEATDHRKKLIAERFSSKHFSGYPLEVSFFKRLGNFSFLKIDKEGELGKIGKSSVISLNLESPSSETKELAKPFGGKREVELQLRCDGNSKTIEVISEKRVDKTSIIGAPIIMEKKDMKKKHSGRLSVVGVVGLTSEEKLYPCYWGVLDENTRSLETSTVQDQAMAPINLSNQELSAIPETEDQHCLREFGESYVKLLIRSGNLTKEKEKVVEQILIQAVKRHAEFHENPRDDVAQSLKSFIDFLVEAYWVTLVSVGEGSVIIILDCPTLQSLELIWSGYRSGHLDKVAERYLVSEEIKKKFNLDTICLKTSIEKENYLKCRRALVKLPSISSEVRSISEDRWREMKDWTSFSEDIQREMKEYRLISEASQRKIKGKNL